MQDKIQGAVKILGLAVILGNAAQFFTPLFPFAMFVMLPFFNIASALFPYPLQYLIFFLPVDIIQQQYIQMFFNLVTIAIGFGLLVLKNIARVTMVVFSLAAVVSTIIAALWLLCASKVGILTGSMRLLPSLVIHILPPLFYLFFMTRPNVKTRFK